VSDTFWRDEMMHVQLSLDAEERQAQSKCDLCSACGSLGVLIYGQSIALHAAKGEGWQAYCPNHLCKVGFTSVFEHRDRAVEAWNKQQRITGTVGILKGVLA
jgi:hypothetical protein